MKIFKFTLSPTFPIVKMPKGAGIISAQSQGDSVCIWAIVDPDAPLEERLFEVIGTGHEIPPGKRRFIDTVQLMGGSLVFHVFELMGEELEVKND